MAKNKKKSANASSGPSSVRNAAEATEEAAVQAEERTESKENGVETKDEVVVNGGGVVPAVELEKVVEPQVAAEESNNVERATETDEAEPAATQLA